MYSEKTNQKRLARDHNKNDRSIDRHIWPKCGIPLPLWLYISSASSDQNSGVNKNEEINCFLKDYGNIEGYILEIS
jgi:hypothetical protein